MSKKSRDYIERFIGDEPPVIEIEDVCKSYQPGVDALKDVNISIERGEFVFIVGHSGSGKSTLIKLLMKEVNPSSGKIYVNNKDLSRIRHNQIPMLRRKIGVVFQDFRLLKDRNIYENVAFAQRVIEKSSKDISRNVPSVLSIVGLKDQMDKFPKELSGGEQQRVSIGRALIYSPAIVLADEPTGNLDSEASQEIIRLLEDSNQKYNQTIVIITHDERIAMRAKRVLTMKDGQVVRDERVRR